MTKLLIAIITIVALLILAAMVTKLCIYYDNSRKPKKVVHEYHGAVLSANMPEQDQKKFI